MVDPSKGKRLREVMLQANTEKTHYARCGVQNLDGLCVRITKDAYDNEHKQWIQNAHNACAYTGTHCDAWNASSRPQKFNASSGFQCLVSSRVHPVLLDA